MGLEYENPCGISLLRQQPPPCTGGIGTYETLALLVGGRRRLPRDLALELAANFGAM